MDRNGKESLEHGFEIKSLSARRAWIEISMLRLGVQSLEVALRKESVDRNEINARREAERTASLSARRAWIEMSSTQRTMRTP